MSVLHIIEIIIFIAASFGIYKLFKAKKYQIPTCLAVITLLFLILLFQFVFLPGHSGPSISFKGGDHLTLEVGTNYDVNSVIATDGLSDITDLLKADSTPDTTKTGEYTIRYTLEYKGDVYYKDRVVSVVDTTAPVIELKEKTAFLAMDNYDGDITANVQVETEQQKDGKYLLTYTVSDSSGNKTTATRTVETLDTEAPVIELNGNKIKVIMVGETYKDEGVKAIDNMDGDVSSRVQSDCGGSFKSDVAGIYKIQYTAEDSSGNKSTATRTVHVLNKIGYDSSLWKTPDGKGVVYLTFDDGPSEVTIKNLDILKQYGVKATFFIVNHNYNESTKPIIKRIIEEGHTLALHDGNNHDYDKTYGSKTSYLEGINRLHDQVLADFGYDARIIRFPGGASNQVSKKPSPGLMGTLPKLMLDNGYLYYDWNVDSTDATTTNAKDPVAIYNNVTKGLKQGRINVVLMHDIKSKTATNEALDDIIKYGIDNGYNFAAITEDTPLVCHNATNV
ncbi:MAG: DUF5011 domain-containing protein [Ruminococcaceae bacterium]|nr:DUF5011 domain-containing protein [Oscillospiraceae bacterium]